MNNTLKSLAFFLGIVCLHSNPVSASDPHEFIDTKAQEMVAVIRNNQELFAKDPTRLVEKSIKGMLPKNKLGAALFRNLTVVTGTKHAHEAQKPKTINLNEFK